MVGDDYSYRPTISDDGRYVAFDSRATNLVDGGVTTRWHIFLKDMQTGVTSIVDITPAGVQGNNDSVMPSLSGDGRFIAFKSFATNLVTSPDTNTKPDIFVKDLQTGEFRRISTDSQGAQSNEYSNYPCISQDGRYVSFASLASNLVAGDNNANYDQFLVENPFAPKVSLSKLSRNEWLSVRTRSLALHAQDRIDAYINELNAAEGQIGSIVSRFETALNNFASIRDNMVAAESRIMDADIGQESAEVTRNQILRNVATSILTQANQAPRIALDLLRNSA